MTPTGAIQLEERKMIPKGQKIEPAQGKLGVMLPGMGAVTSTFIAGVDSIKKGYA
jgi:myo-inositol-1-phosphate synthase